MKKLLLLTAIILSLFSCTPDEQDGGCPRVTNTGTQYLNGQPMRNYILLDNGSTIYNVNPNIKSGDYYCN